MSKQHSAVTTNLVGSTLTLGDSRDHIDKSKADFLRLQTLSRDFNGTNAAEIFQRHDLNQRSHSRHMFSNLNAKNLSSAQKIEEDSSDGQITQDSNDTGDDASGLNGETSFRLSNSMSNLKTDPSLTSHAGDLLMSSGRGRLSPPSVSSSSSINPYNVPSEGRFFIPVHQLSNSRLVTLPQNLMVSPASMGLNSSAPQQTEEASQKRQLRLLKNKEAAKECRRKKKEYVKCLENRVAVLENQNKTLIEELKSLKELYCQKDVQS